jgi:hypothetical protein
MGMSRSDEETPEPEQDVDVEDEVPLDKPITVDPFDPSAPDADPIGPAL